MENGNLQNVTKETALDLTRSNEQYEQIRTDIHEFAQGVTDFQIEVFITNGEGGINEFPVHTYRHLLAQVRPLISEIRRVAITKERKLREIERIKEKISNPVCDENDLDLDLMELEFTLEELDIDLKGKWATYETYEKLLTYIRDEHGPFSNEQLQADEAKYWKYRLSKQMVDSREGAMSGFGGGNLNSLRMAIQGSPMPDTIHRINSIDMQPEKLTENVQRTAFKKMIE